jgi:tetratricopeptide (TPR) repeat protein
MEEAVTPSFGKRNAAVICGVVLVASWGLFFFFLFPLVALAILSVGIYLGFNSRKASMVLLLCSPLVVVPIGSFAWGTWGYLSGGGSLRGFGRPDAEYSNLDPTCRCPRVSSGCVINGSEFLTHNPNNLAIEILTKIFGPMRGAYAGPYPSREEALRTLESAQTQLLICELAAYVAELGLPQGAPAAALEREISQQLEKDLPIRAAVFRGETVVVGREKCLFLVDRKTGRRYARYFFESSAWMHLANGEVDKAIVELDHAINVDPRNSDYLQERGDAYLQKGDTLRARADFKKALEMAPTDSYRRRELERKIAGMKGGSP